MKQGYNAILDESLGSKNGKKSQSLKARRDESKAMSKKDYDTLMVVTILWVMKYITQKVLKLI